MWASHPFDGADAKGEGEKTRKAEDEVDEVEHCGTPGMEPQQSVPPGRKGAIRDWASGRKFRVKDHGVFVTCFSGDTVALARTSGCFSALLQVPCRAASDRFPPREAALSDSGVS